MSILRIRDENGIVQEILAIKGEPGKDGHTPVKGVDYFDGVDGKDGKDGEDGKDYALTDADKQDIASIVMSNASIAYVGSAAPANDVGKDGDIYIVSG